MDSHEYDITNIKHSHGMNTCMAQLPGKCENVLTRPSCLDGSSSGVESEIKSINGFGSQTQPNSPI